MFLYTCMFFLLPLSSTPHLISNTIPPHCASFNLPEYSLFSYTLSSSSLSFLFYGFTIVHVHVSFFYIFLIFASVCLYPMCIFLPLYFPFYICMYSSPPSLSLSLSPSFPTFSLSLLLKVFLTLNSTCALIVLIHLFALYDVHSILSLNFIPSLSLSHLVCLCLLSFLSTLFCLI